MNYDDEIIISQDGRKVRRLCHPVIKKDGTVWVDTKKGIKPIVTGTCHIRLGENAHNIWAGTSKDWEKHPNNLDRIDEIKEEDKRDHEISFLISTRGWGDYSSLRWVGDVRMGDEAILAECKEMYDNGDDLDMPFEAEKILDKIKNAKKEWGEKPQREAEEAQRLQALVNDPGYCFNCETWCYGACGGFSKDPNRQWRHRLD